LQHTSTAPRLRLSRIFGSRFEEEVKHMNKARLFSLLITAALMTMLLAKAGVILHNGGFNDGGFW
jgi:hypothetical protein